MSVNLLSFKDTNFPGPLVKNQHKLESMYFPCAVHIVITGRRKYSEFDSFRYSMKVKSAEHLPGVRIAGRGMGSLLQSTSSDHLHFTALKGRSQAEVPPECLHLRRQPKLQGVRATSLSEVFCNIRGGQTLPFLSHVFLLVANLSIKRIPPTSDMRFL